MDSEKEKTVNNTNDTNNGMVKTEEEDTTDGEPKPKKIKVKETYRNCSEGTISFRVSNVSKQLTYDGLTLYSPVEYVNGIPWKIGTKYMPGRKLGVFLYLDENEVGTNVEVYTEYNFSLINQLNSLKTITKPPRFDIIKSGIAYGDTSFITMDEMLHSYNNYVMDDQAIIEAYITCGSLISNKQKNDFFSNRSRDKELSEYIWTRVNYIIDNGIGSDCELVFMKDGEEIVKKASKAILTRVSAVFEKMFYGSTASQDRVKITNVEEDIFDALLMHAYGGKWEFGSKDKGVALYLAACAYEMKDLQNVCMEYLWPRVLSDVWIFLNMSDKSELKHMKAAAVKVFARCASEGFISEQFTHITHEALVGVVSQVALNVRSELDVFDGVVRWSKAQCAKRELEVTRENLRSVAGEAINMIRFLAMTHGEFESSPMLSDILSAEEKVLMLTRIIYKKKNSSMNQLCCLVKPRLRL